MKVLVLEDDPVCRILITSVLDIMGVDYDDHDDASKAKEPINSYDLIILDWLMPSMTGYDFVKAIRKKGSDCSPYILMISSLASESDIKDALQAGVNSYLTKPINMALLKGRINTAFKMVTPIATMIQH